MTSSPVTLNAPILRRRYGNVVWDGIVRGSGIAALLSIPVATSFPNAGALVGFVLVTIWVNGPIAPFLPATYEPILMLSGRLYPAILIASLGIAGTIYVEYLNYKLYRHILHASPLRRLRESTPVRRTLGLYSRAPFFTIWLCSWSPFPYWSVRFLSPLAGFPVSRHLFATFLGRFPRLWFFAALGVWWGIDMRILVGVSVGSILLAITVWLWKSRERALAWATTDPADQNPQSREPLIPAPPLEQAQDRDA